MRKKILVAAAAVAMAAVVSLSAFAAESVSLSSPTSSGIGTSFVSGSKKTSTEEAQDVYTELTSGEGTLEEKLTEIVGEETLKEVMKDLGVDDANKLAARAAGDVVGDVSSIDLNVDGAKNGEYAVILYRDSKGKWLKARVAVANGRIQFSLPYETTIILLTKNAS